MVNMTTSSISSKKERKGQEYSAQPGPSLDQVHAASRHSTLIEEDSDEDEDYQLSYQEVCRYLLVLLTWFILAFMNFNIAACAGVPS